MVDVLYREVGELVFFDCQRMLYTRAQVMLFVNYLVVAMLKVAVSFEPLRISACE